MQFSLVVSHEECEVQRVDIEGRFPRPTEHHFTPAGRHFPHASRESTDLILRFEMVRFDSVGPISLCSRGVKNPSCVQETFPVFVHTLFGQKSEQREPFCGNLR